MEEKCWVAVSSFMSGFLSGCLDLDYNVYGTAADQI